MDWITTNIRFPKDEYMELKMEAAMLRKSIAQIVRERVRQKKKISTRADIEKFMKRSAKIAKEIARQNKGISLSKALIEMRYEQ